MPVTSCCPAVLVAAPASGQGKTTVAAALARLHTRAGRRVRTFKCGPDFLDPFWLGLASGKPVHNVDLWMTGEADARARLHAAACEADLIIIEGVMGLYDGEPSAADLAVHFGIPVLAVIDASAMAGTFGALAFGLQHYRPGLPWAGVLANKVAGERHALMLQEAITPTPATNSDEQSEAWLGAVLRDAAFSLPERHLGLTMASELPDALQRLDAAADALESTPLGQMNGAALEPWMVSFEPANSAENFVPALAGKVVAVARDAAFCFIYAANLETLEALGAQLVFFSPLANESVPDCDALWLPGGYPELHAQNLCDAFDTRTSLAAHVMADKPVWAECGGMMVLFEQLMTMNEKAYPMWGVLSGSVHMQTKLAGLGPQQLELPGDPLNSDSLLAPLRGHTFHYSHCDSDLLPTAHTVSPKAGQTGEALWCQGSVRASYFHAWFASSPAAAANLFTQQSSA